MGRTAATRRGFGMGYSPPAPVFTLTSASDGGWPGQMGAVYFNGTTYFGYVDGNNGDIEARSFDHATRVTSSAFTLNSAFGVDHHNDPWFLVRASDSRLLVAYCDHNGTAMYIRISTNPEDASAWGAETNIDASLGGSDYTYPNLFQTSDGTIWLFYRHVSSGTSQLTYSTSTDDGATWAAQTVIYSETSEDTYWRIFLGADDRFDFVVSDGTQDGDNASAYHFYMDDAGDYFETDGTPISIPLDPTDLTLVYNGTGGDGVRLPYDIRREGTDIAVLLVTQPGGALNYRYIRWDGATWTGHLIVNAGGTAAFVEGGLALYDIDTVYLSRVASGQWQMFRYTTTDDGDNWSESQITTAATPHFYPVIPKDAGSGLRAMWLVGTFTSQSNFSLGIEGTPR